MGGGSSWFQGLMGAFGGIGGALGHMNSISPGATAAILGAGGGFVGLYANGGYTGSGGRNEPAGVVHRGEYVFDAASTSRIGISNLEAMRRMPGYADGGPVAANRNLGSANSNRPGVKIVNVMDPRVVGDYLATPDGEQVVMNVMRRLGK
jgi:lambda family phage tail tape measure protein